MSLTSPVAGDPAAQAPAEAPGAPDVVAPAKGAAAPAPAAAPLSAHGVGEPVEGNPDGGNALPLSSTPAPTVQTCQPGAPIPGSAVATVSVKPPPDSPTDASQANGAVATSVGASSPGDNALPLSSVPAPTVQTCDPGAPIPGSTVATAARWPTVSVKPPPDSPTDASQANGAVATRGASSAGGPHSQVARQQLADRQKRARPSTSPAGTVGGVGTPTGPTKSQQLRPSKKRRRRSSGRPRCTLQGRTGLCSGAQPPHSCPRRHVLCVCVTRGVLLLLGVLCCVFARFHHWLQRMAVFQQVWRQPRQVSPLQGGFCQGSVDAAPGWLYLPAGTCTAGSGRART